MASPQARPGNRTALSLRVEPAHPPFAQTRAVSDDKGFPDPLGPSKGPTNGLCSGNLLQGAEAHKRVLVSTGAGRYWKAQGIGGYWKALEGTEYWRVLQDTEYWRVLERTGRHKVLEGTGRNWTAHSTGGHRKILEGRVLEGTEYWRELEHSGRHRVLESTERYRKVLQGTEYWRVLKVLESTE